jgi:tRNA pseudouridine13 synthase
LSDLDESIGITFGTQFEGIGGRIRSSPEDFVVEEVIDGRFLSSIRPEYLEPSFAVFALAKNGIDSIHAAKLAAQTLHSKVRILGFKDSKASTKQYLAVRTRKPLATSFTKDRFSLSLLGYTKEDFSPRLLLGNRFKTWIRSIKVSEDETRRTLEIASTLFKGRAFPNFYGHQRFGSARPVTHVVGRYIVQGSFKDAVNAFITVPSTIDGKEVAEARRLFSDGKLKESLNGFQAKDDIERTIITSLFEKPGDYLLALRKVSLRVRKLFVAAYSSFIFNKVLSRAIEKGETLRAGDGDVVAEFGSDYRMGRPLILATVPKQDNRLVPMVPTAGYGYYQKKSRFDLLLQEIMKEEGVVPKMFHVKDAPEMSLETSLRPAPLIGNIFDYAIDGSNMLIDFFLAKGSYATILLREITKTGIS